MSKFLFTGRIVFGRIEFGRGVVIRRGIGKFYCCILI